MLFDSEIQFNFEIGPNVDSSIDSIDPGPPPTNFPQKVWIVPALSPYFRMAEIGFHVNRYNF